jgi:hypothetical protein
VQQRRGTGPPPLAEPRTHELKISRRSFDRWRALGTGPKVKHLAGNGSIRIRRSWLNEWLDATDEDIA